MDSDIHFMHRALELARRGEGRVEPNPMVGCVLVRDGRIVGEGFHDKYGGPHAEVEAIRSASERGGEGARGADCYVTLEPCSHHGKTPPCTSAVLAAGIRRVVVAMRDPNPVVDGRGLTILRDAGLEVRENVLETESRKLNAPYLTLLEKRRPWVIAKWAMTLDGRTASRTGSSRWISGEKSRETVHRLRARMDGILVGAGTVEKDDPTLTARLPNGETPLRTPLRIVLDDRLTISRESRLVRTARETPVLIVTDSHADRKKMETLQNLGCEVLPVHSDSNDNPIRHREQIDVLLKNLGENRMTNLLVEGGSGVFGRFFDLQLIDEIHVFVAPKLIGGGDAVPCVGGLGLPEMESPCMLNDVRIETLDGDIYVMGRTRFP